MDIYMYICAMAGSFKCFGRVLNARATFARSKEHPAIYGKYTYWRTFILYVTFKSFVVISHFTVVCS